MTRRTYEESISVLIEKKRLEETPRYGDEVLALSFFRTRLSEQREVIEWSFSEGDEPSGG